MSQDINELEERKEFEAHVQRDISDDPTVLFRKNVPGEVRDGEYVNEKIQRHWLGWKARADLRQAERQAPEGFVQVPLNAYLWLMGLGNDGFTEDRNGAFWWRGAFNDRAGLEMMDIYEASRAAPSAGQAKVECIVINATQQNVLLAAAEALDDLGAPLNAADIRMIIGLPSAGQAKPDDQNWQLREGDQFAATGKERI